MQNSITKLAVIAGVIGVVSLAMLQAQRGMNGGDADRAAGDTSQPAPQVNLGQSQPSAEFPELADEFAPGGQVEPDDGFDAISPARPTAPGRLTESQVAGLPLASRSAADAAPLRPTPDPLDFGDDLPRATATAEPGVRPVSMPGGRRPLLQDDEFFLDEPFSTAPAATEHDAGPARSETPARRAIEPPDASGHSAESASPFPAAPDDDFEIVPARRDSAVPADLPPSSEGEEAPAAPPASSDRREPRPIAPTPVLPGDPELGGPDPFDFDLRDRRPPPLADEPELADPPSTDEVPSAPPNPFEDRASEPPTIDPTIAPAPAESAAPLRALPKLPFSEDADRGHVAEETSASPVVPEPARLPAPAGAAQAADSTAGDLLGDGTVDPAVPSGPQKPQITLEKIAPATALLGQPLVYSIVVRNAGESPASDVVVEDRIPAGTKLTGTNPRAELVDKNLIWRLGTLEPGDEKKISVRVTPLAEGEIGSVATVNFVAEVAALTKITTPRLKLTLDAPEQARVGDAVVFRFNVTNAGESEARNVLLRDLIPDGLSHPDGEDLEYVVGDLAAGETKEVKLTLTAARPGRTVNRAIITAEGNLSVEGSAALDIVGAALAIARTGPARQFVGRETIFTNAVTNESDRRIAAATVTETVPEGYEFLEASQGGQFNPGLRTIAWNLENLDPGQSSVLKTKLRPTGTGTLESVVQVVDPAGNGALAKSQTTVVGFAALGMDLTSERIPALVGDEIPIEIVVRNQGTAAATRVRVTLDLPQELELVSAEGPTAFRQQGRQVAFEPIPELGFDEPAKIRAVFRAARAGDARVRVAIEADQMQRPLIREEAALVLDAAP